MKDEPAMSLLGSSLSFSLFRSLSLSLSLSLAGEEEEEEEEVEVETESDAAGDAEGVAVDAVLCDAAGDGAEAE